MDQFLLFAALNVLLILSFALMALSQDRNWRLVVTDPPLSHGAKVTLRSIGATLLALAIPLAVWRDGPSFGSLMWGTMISITACTVTAALSWKPQWLRPLALVITKLEWRQHSGEVRRKQRPYLTK